MDNGWDLWLSYFGFTVIQLLEAPNHLITHWIWSDSPCSPDFSGTIPRGRGSPNSCLIGSLQLFGWSYLSHQGTWVLQSLDDVADSTDKCVCMNPLHSENTDLCAQYVTRCLSCKILLVNLKGLRGPFLKAFVLLTFRHVFGKCDFMNSVNISVQTVLLFKCIFTVNPLPNLGEKENHN